MINAHLSVMQLDKHFSKSGPTIRLTITQGIQGIIC